MKYLYVALVLLLPCSTSSASILGNLIDYDNTIDTLVDASAGKIIDKNSNNTIDDGDIIQGLVHFNQIDGNSSYSGSVFAAYSFEVASATASQVTLQAASGADNVRTILASDGVDVSGLSAYKGRSGSSAFVVLENSTDGLNLENMDGSGTDADGSNGIVGDFDNTWTAVLSAGFDGVDDAHTIFAGNIGGTPVDLTDLPGISNIGGGIQFATFGGSYTILETMGVLGAPYQYHEITNGLIGGKGEIVIQNGVLEGFNAGVSGENWTFQDDGSYFINPSSVPEPSTLAIWAALGLGGCGLVARRRIMKAQKA